METKLHNKCLDCSLWKDANRAVIGEGPLNAQIMLIGQGPGKEEDRLGRPFVGRSGKFLDGVLAKNGIKRESVFITSVLKCRTPQNREPSEGEIRDCMPLLMEQIIQIRPEIVVLMGEVARKTPRVEGIRYIETYHPAAAMRFPKLRKKFEEDFTKLSKWSN